jgi:phage terminase large subunit-like protein
VSVEPLVLPTGRQKPRVLHRPEFDGEDDARDAVDVMEMCGQILDPWQVLLVCITLATLHGNLAASSVGALVARQNGKGGWLEAIAVWSLFEAHLTGKQYGTDPKHAGTKNFTLWTAHELKTTDEAYLRVKALIRANDELGAEVLKWDGGLTGQHIIELRDGSRLAFLARSKSSGRGFSPRRVIFDEAQEFSMLAHRAMLYATAAQGVHRQLIYTGTVPSDENNSEIWTGVRDVGRAGTSKRAAWAEWTPTGSDSPKHTTDPTSWAARAQANPALGSERLLHETIDAEWEAAQSDIEGFLRERLSIWPTLPADYATAVIPASTWEACLDPNSKVADRGTFVLDVSPKRTWAAIVVAGSRSDGLPHIEITSRAGVIDHRPGVDWIVERAKALKDAHPGFVLTIVSGSPAESLVPALAVAGITVEFAKSSDVPAACGMFYDRATTGALRHIGQSDLTDALKGARKNNDDGEGAWRWGRRKSSADITPLYAATVALWALTASPPVEPSIHFL